MIELRDVSKHYGRRSALAGVSLRLNPGEVTLLLGANGAGKSTLLRCLLGIVDFGGSVSVCGLDPLSDGCTVRALIGYMPQSGGLHPDLTVDETMGLFADIRKVPRERGTALLAEAGMAAHRSTKVGELSGGMRQRLGFALALLTNPRILILDEPTASLDAASRDWLARRLRAVASEGRLVLVSTHGGQELLAAGDRRVTLEDGRVVSDEQVSGSISPREMAHEVVPPNGSVMPLAIKEVRDAVRNGWLVGYAAVLAALGVAAAATGIDSSSGLALQAYGRTTATLMNLCLLLVPLVAVLMGGSSIAGERERGTLEHLLAQPVSPAALLLSKHAGVVLSLTAATVVGFLPAGLLIAWQTGGVMLGHYLLFPVLASLVGAAMAALGLLVSVSSRSAAQAQAASIVSWFAFVLLYDLMLLGTLAFMSMPVQCLAVALIANPVDAGRVLGVLALEPDLYLLGPAGAYLAAEFSRGGAAMTLLASLALWATAPAAAAVIVFDLQVRARWRQAIERYRAGSSTLAARSSRRHSSPRANEEVTSS